MRGSGRTRVFNNCKERFAERFPRVRALFLNDPFKELPHPLLWAAGERDLHPVSRLFKCWSPLNDFNLKYLRPALEEYDLVATDGYGLNAVLYSTACDECEDTDDEVISMHHSIVAARVREQGIEPPEYLVTYAGPHILIPYLKKNVSDDLTDEACLAFIKKEEKIIRDYFDLGSGQKTPILLDASMTTDAMTEMALSIMESRLAERRA